MKYTIPALFVWFVLVGQASAQPQWGPRPPVPNGPFGVWYMGGDPFQPCEIIPKGGGRAVFVNERGQWARGHIEGNRIVVPDWGDWRRGGLEGTVGRNTIHWSNGTWWAR